MIDWSAGSYEDTAAELAPVSEVVIDQADVSAGTVVVDLACGTGNAALLAAARGASVIGVDGAARLLEVARARAAAEGRSVDFRHGDLLSVPVADRCADVVVSVFGIIFAPHPAAALGEVARIVTPDGRCLIAAWVPAGPIDAMVGAAGRIIGRITQSPPRSRLAWSDAEFVRELAASVNLSLMSTRSLSLEIRAQSPEAYLDAGENHPMAIAGKAAVAAAGASDELRAAMLAPLHEGNEDPDAFLVHSPYVVHELRPR